MTRKASLTIFYSCVALISAAILTTAFFVRSKLKRPELSTFIDSGREEVRSFFPIAKDLAAINQSGAAVKLSDLKGKVWIVAEFFAVCPHCAVRNGEELRKIYDEFGKHPDFHITCISVDPENDQVAKLKDYAQALGADAKNWWFLNAGSASGTHEYLEQTLKFFGIRERTNAQDMEANGRYLHDLGFLLVDRDFNVIGKWPLADARSEEARQRDPKLYERIKADMFNRIRTELNRPGTKP
ncbi:MAG: SCO family protein [Verrucomicrobiota bacterium]